MSSSDGQFLATLKQYGYSSTTARHTVFHALLGQEPQTMRRLAASCVPAINRASLYRTVELFEQLGIVHRLHIGWKYKLELSDQFQPHHHHAICTGCGLIVTLPENSAIEQQLTVLANGTGFTVVEHQLELRGRCAACVAITTP